MKAAGAPIKWSPLRNMAAARLLDKGLSLRGVAAELERRGVRSRTGRGFAPVQVKRMVG